MREREDEVDAVWIVRAGDGTVVRITHKESEASPMNYPSFFTIERRALTAALEGPRD